MNHHYGKQMGPLSGKDRYGAGAISQAISCLPSERICLLSVGNDSIRDCK